MTPGEPQVRRGFSLIEIMVVVVVLGVLAAIVLPRFAGVTRQAEASALQADLGAVRSAIQNHRTRAVLAGEAPYPAINTIPDLVSGGVPSNPYTGASGVQFVTRAQAELRSVINPQAVGWNYFVDNQSDPPIAIFYANCEDPTNVLDGAGSLLSANQL